MCAISNLKLLAILVRDNNLVSCKVKHFSIVLLGSSVVYKVKQYRGG